MRIYLPIIIFCCLIFQNLKAQQYPLFTNYILNCFGYNPAVAGSTDYIDTRLSLRNQWTKLEGAPMTQILSAQGRLKKLPIGVGGYVFNDVAGSMKRTGGSLVSSYSMLIDSTHRVCIGASVGMYSIGLKNIEALATSSDPTLFNAANGVNVPDFNVGVYYSHAKGLFAGVSAPQVLKGNLDFTSDPTQINPSELVRHYYIMAGYNLKLNDKLKLQPSALVKLAEDSPWQYDVSLVATFYDQFWAGASYRSEDAIALMAGYDIDRTITLGYSYDLTTSMLKQANSGSHEIVVGFRIGIDKDRDDDGIPDKKDKCPDEPGTVENEGCPEDLLDDSLADEDRDKDGILNDDDECPDEAGPKENNGCPWGDRDKDGIRDDIDNCPDQPGVPTNDGCPLSDRDKDGILDNKDKCPDIPGVMSNEGCPPVAVAVSDRDGDGVPDSIDKCPDLKGRGQDGCPRISDEERLILDLAIQNIYFDTNKDEIKRHSFPYLDRLATLMIGRRELKVRISGHADERGERNYNLDLSKRRAESVMFYLLNRGVKRSQLSVEYFGEEMPASRELDENRRVEMDFVWD